MRRIGDIKTTRMDGKFALTIPLTRGMRAIIDRDDFDKVKDIYWSAHKGMSTYYAQSKKYQMHRLIMGLKYNDGLVVDHINWNGLDNRKSNLRICTHALNILNSRKKKNTTSKYKGVCFHKKIKKWQAYITINGIQTGLGYFVLEKDAANAYNEMSIKYHNGYSKLNDTEIP